MSIDLPKPRHFPPPPLRPAQTGRFRRVPPAIFSPILGVLALGMTWRLGAEAFGIPSAVVELFLGAASLLFLFAAAAYVVKLILRPTVFLDDLRPLPGRTGLAALAMSTMMFSAVLVPYTPDVAVTVLVIGAALLAILGVIVLKHILFSPDRIAPITPALQLVFVGFLVSPFAAMPMGWGAFVPYLSWYATAAATLICARTFSPILTGVEPLPLRPLHAIHLAPAALIASAALKCDQTLLGLFMLGLSTAVAVLLLVRARWMIEGGFSGFWSAFTFPSAAFAAAWLFAWSLYGWESARIIGGLALVFATLIIPPIALRVLRLWADGTLAAKTNAQIA